MNKITTYIGALQRPATLILMFWIINPHALDAFLSVEAQQYCMKVYAVVIAFIGFLKDVKTADAKTVTDLIQAVPTSPSSPLAAIKEMKAATVAVSLIVVSNIFLSCSTGSGIKVIQAIQSVQNNPAIQAAELEAASITVPAPYQSLAPIAVQELTAVANGSNPIGVTGNSATDAENLIEAVSAMIPTNDGSNVAAKVANTYLTAMKQPGMTQTPGTANAVITAIAKGLSTLTQP